MRLEIERTERRFASPQHTAHGVLRARPLILVTLIAADGARGRGEAAPLPSYDGVSPELVIDALEAYRPILARADSGGPGARMDALRERADLPQALAAIDMAVWDMAGTRSGRPICDLLCDRPATAIAVNATVAIADSEGAARAAGDAVRAGFSCVKLKVGFPNDLERVAAVRAAMGPHARLRLDANGAWTLPEAQRMLDGLGLHDLELVEEPVRGLTSTRILRERVAIRIAIDESASLSGALTARVADAVCLKLSRCGGIGGLLAAASLVRASGAEAYVASTFDGPRGIAAALHCAAALAPLPACGLATLELFDGEPSPFPVHDGVIDVPRGPGLGCEH